MAEKKEKAAKNYSQNEHSSSSKTKPISKPKKFKKKLKDQINRIIKSKSEKIYLIQGKRFSAQPKWFFLLQGIYGKVYETVVAQKLSCTCLDFRFKGKPCKHHYFFVTKIIENEQYLDYFRSSSKLSKNAFRTIDEALVQSINSKLKEVEADVKEIDFRGQSQCIFCFSDMNQEQKLESCQVCKKYFHESCLKEWKVQSLTCPLCRQMLGGDCPFGMLKSLQL